MENEITLTGRITHIVYHNEDTFYTVLKFLLLEQSEKTITVTGLFTSVEKDVLYHLSGTYVEHPKYGMQFQITSYKRAYPQEKDGIIRYLSGVQFPGIGKKTAEKIVSNLGEDAIKKIKEDQSVLLTIPGLTNDKMEIIYQGIMREDDGMEELIKFLNIHGIGMRNLIRLNRTYGKEALVKIQENPYRVIEECDGFGFVTADKIAMSLGFSKNDTRRLYAYLVYLCMELCMQSGDSYVPSITLQESFEKDCEGLEYSYDDLFHEAILKRRLVCEDHNVYPISQYNAEDFISTFLTEFPYQKLEDCDDTYLKQYLKGLQEDLKITYDTTQVEAIETVFHSPFSIITGGPGTGKTTVVKAIVDLFKLLYPSSTILCAAPTGRASKRLAELTDTSAQTIHSLLKWDLETNTFGVNEDVPIYAELLIVDEFSMVDNWLFYNLLIASKQVRKICIIGDEDQLPSVSPGCLLRDLIQSNLFPVIRLNHIYRQKEGSDVISLAHDIHSGDVDFSRYQNDFAFLKCDRIAIKNTVIKVVQNALEKGYTIDEIQVLSPMYNGNAGIDVLNNALQAAFNPPDGLKEEYKFGYTTFREGDKILQLKNQPDDDVFNGDIGLLVEIIKAEFSETNKTTLVVDFDGVIVTYTQETLPNISLAYCISVHKSQGSEYPIVIMPITSQHTIMLQRKLLYTAVTRARTSLILLGEEEAFYRGIEIIDRHPRNTTLVSRLIHKKEHPPLKR